MGRADDAHTAEAIVPAVLLLGVLLGRGSAQRVALALRRGHPIAVGTLPLTTIGTSGNQYDQALMAAVAVVQATRSQTSRSLLGKSRISTLWRTR